MYVKWIVCNVEKGLEEAFSKAQELWIETQNAPGFIGQVGGWDLKSKNTACIISFWEEEGALKLFMKNMHDKIFSDNKQSDYYTDINVDYFNSLLKMEGRLNSFKDVFSEAQLLRIADCKVHAQRTDHFENVQRNIWLPGMKKAKGMLGGRFSKAEDETSRYLVSSFWDSIGHHTNYVEKALPEYKIKADINKDIDSIMGWQVSLVDSWRVIGKITDHQSFW
jgi:heme-degrading monooxygenase HmoA